MIEVNRLNKCISVLGSTGSIGTQTIEVAARLGIKVSALAASGSRPELLENQARLVKPRIVAVADEAAAADVKTRLDDTDIRVLSGEEGVITAAAEPSADTVVSAIVGIAGLKPTLAAINAKKDIALANKETLVTAGPIVNAAAARNGVKIYPVDSEHSAIFQSMQGVPEGSVKKIILTASGGPFFGKTRAELQNVTPADALKHPNWDMGAKITIDSATLMNKGFEVIEAIFLFGVTADDVEVVVHRQSIIHSAIELADGAVIAQLGTPDMKLPIQYALTYPERLPCSEKKLSLTDIGTLTFHKPDTEVFGALKVCTDAVRHGGLKPCAVNGANEAAVALFLKGKLPFLKIAELAKGAADAEKRTGNFTLGDVLDADAAAREYVYANV